MQNALLLQNPLLEQSAQVNLFFKVHLQGKVHFQCKVDFKGKVYFCESHGGRQNLPAPTHIANYGVLCLENMFLEAQPPYT